MVMKPFGRTIEREKMLATSLDRAAGRYRPRFRMLRWLR